MSDRTFTLPPGPPGAGTDGDRRARGAEPRRGPLWPLPATGPGPGHDDPRPTAEDSRRFINRELSWLEFGARLLDLVADDRVPLLERVKFMGIFAE
ncbi:MAG TPA: hypothetical protein VHW93_08130, partial [Acidimicrobiales bacterium]|nr:hypothetical protein [Acidimicrobiales bacterium]